MLLSLAAVVQQKHNEKRINNLENVQQIAFVSIAMAGNVGQQIVLVTSVTQKHAGKVTVKVAANVSLRIVHVVSK